MRQSPRNLGPTRTLAIALLVVAGCSVPRPSEQWLSFKRHHASTAAGLGQPGAPDSATAVAELPLDERIRARLRGPDPEFDETHPRVEQFVRNFTTRSRRSYQMSLDRSAHFVPLIIPILEEEGVAPELAYLPMIESGFRTEAVSPRGAVGAWQFVRGTGKLYGLRIDWYVDERRDPIKSTRAAAKYLRTLYDMFGSWHLALAAYNTGEVRIANAINNRGAETFWEMMEKRYLHPETMSFVPQFLAALRIARDPAAYGFDPPAYKNVDLDEVAVKRSLSLSTLAKLSGTAEAEIRNLNPGLIRGVTPPDAVGYPVHLPAGKGEQFAIAYAQMMRKNPREVATAAGGQYRVRPGDTPAGIARRFGVSVNDLMHSNGWHDPRRIRVGDLAVIPGHDLTAGAPGTYRVRPGDTPSVIAERFGVPVKALMRANGWRDARRIRVGVLARLPTGARSSVGNGDEESPAAADVTTGTSPVAAGTETLSSAQLAARGEAEVAGETETGDQGDEPAATKSVEYRIRRGDNPTLIAKRFGVSVDALMKTNGWKDARRIRAGDVARIPIANDDAEEALRLAARRGGDAGDVN